jgi:hypothetical protein
MGPTGSEPTEHIRDRDPHVAYARATAVLAGFN